MKNFTKYAFMLMVLLNSTAASALVDIACFKYEPAMVTLIGILQIRVYPGAPNFISIEAGDEPETSYSIVLKPPICTITKEETWMLGHERISEVQLAVSKLQFGQLDANLGKVVTVKGSLFEAFDEHHHTPVLMDVKSLVGTDRNDGTVATKAEKPLKPLPQSTLAAKVAPPVKQLKPTKSTMPTKKTSAKKQAGKAKPKTLKQKSKTTKSKKQKK